MEHSDPGHSMQPDGEGPHAASKVWEPVSRAHGIHDATRSWWSTHDNTSSRVPCGQLPHPVRICSLARVPRSTHKRQSDPGSLTWWPVEQWNEEGQDTHEAMHVPLTQRWHDKISICTTFSCPFRPNMCMCVRTLAVVATSEGVLPVHGLIRQLSDG
jgi:hypothetical protein